ncbi:MAG: hypothetical protein H6887_07735 [Hoeflea sp.]|nr:hypothetical protein [Hoeflea sp.]
MAKEIANATDGFIWVCPARTPRNKEQVGKHSLKLSKLSLEPPGSVPLVEGYLGRMRWSDQAAYLRFIHTLGIDSQRLEKSFPRACRTGDWIHCLFTGSTVLLPGRKPWIQDFRA